MTGAEAYKKLQMCINTKHYIGSTLDNIITKDLEKAQQDIPAAPKAPVAPKKIVKQPKES